MKNSLVSFYNNQPYYINGQEELEEEELELNQINNNETEDLDTLYLNRTFKSYHEFLLVFNNYRKRTNQLFRKGKGEFLKIKNENNEYKLDQNRPYKYQVFECVHFGNGNETKGRFKGACTAKFRLNYELTGEHRDMYKITVFDCTHSHPVTKEEFDLHPQNRRLDEEQSRIARHFLDLGCKPSKVAGYFPIKQQQQNKKSRLEDDLNTFEGRVSMAIKPVQEYVNYIAGFNEEVFKQKYDRLMIVIENLMNEEETELLPSTSNNEDLFYEEKQELIESKEMLVQKEIIVKTEETVEMSRRSKSLKRKLSNVLLKLTNEARIKEEAADNFSQ